MIYCIYQQNGSWKRATVTSLQYERYMKDPSISCLSSYPNNRMMEEAYSQVKGEDFNTKRILHG